MTIPQFLTPSRRGTITSRYLESISCGPNDVSGLSMSSPKSSKWTPEKEQQLQRKALNDISCGMTAPTALLDQTGSASWTTMETRSHGTRSRSDIAGRPSRPLSRSSGSVRRIRSTGGTSGQVKLGIEDDCSSIESSESHRRSKPAHLSIELENPIQLLTNQSVVCSNLNSSFNASLQKHQSREWRNNHRRGSSKGKSDSSWISAGSIFPRTSPKIQEQSPPKNNPLAVPYSLKRNAGGVQSTPQKNSGSDYGESAPTEVMHNLTSFNKDRWKSSVYDDEYAVSEAGAGTEIMTNRTDDVLARPRQPRQPLPGIRPPPPVNRRYWMPSDEPGGNEAMRCLMDDTSNEESTNASHLLSPVSTANHNAHGASLLDARSSSVSAASFSPRQQSRLALHMQESDPFRFSSDQESASLNTGSSSIRVEIGGGDQNVAIRSQASGPIFGGRQVGNGLLARRNSAVRALSQKQPPLPPRSMAMKSAVQTPNVPNMPTENDIFSGSTTDDEHLTFPDFQRKAAEDSISGGFIVYNQRPKANMGEVFQKRPQSDTSSGWSPVSLSGEEDEAPAKSPSPPRPKRLSDYDHGKPSIQPIFSLDRLDFSFDSHSPIRKYRSHSATKKTERIPPTRSKSVSGPIARLQEKEKANQPDPIFCPESLSFASNDAASRSSMLSSRQNSPDSTSDGNRGDVEIKRSVIKSWQDARNVARDVARGDSDVVEEELVHIMDRSQERRARTSESAEGSPAVRLLKELKDAHERKRAETALTVKGIAMQESVSLPNNETETIESKSVKDKIRAFNSRPPDMWHPRSKSWNPAGRKSNLNYQGAHSVSSRKTIVIGAPMEGNVLGEEKKDDTSVDLSAFESCKSIEREDDDTASVKSLREKFERHFDSRHVVVEEDDDDDDTASIKSLREKLEKRILDIESYHGDDDDDNASVKSLRERFEAPPKETSENEVSKIRAMFENKKAPFIPKRGNNLKVLRSQFETTPSKPPTSITTKTKGGKVKAFQPFQKAEIAPGVTRHGKPNSEKSEPCVESGSKERFEEPSQVSDKDPMNDNARFKHVNIYSKNITDQIGDITHPVPAPISQKNVESSRRFNNAGNSNKQEANVFSKPFEGFEKVTNRQTFGPMSNHTAEFNTQNTNEGHDEYKTKQKTHETGPVVSPFLSVRDRLQNFSRGRNGSVKNFVSQEKKRPPQNMHDRLNRWVSRHHINKRNPLADHVESGGRGDEENSLEAGIERTGSYDLSPVNPNIIVEEKAKLAVASSRGKISSHSFDDFFSRTNKAVREKNISRGESSAPTTMHSNHNWACKKSETGGTSQSNSATATEISLQRSRSGSKKDIFRTSRERRAESDDRNHNVPGSHWVQGHRPEKNVVQKASTETEYSDGVTLDLSIAEVSCLTNPSAIRSNESKDSKGMDRQSSSSSSVTELDAKKSDASSSQLSEAAAPLIAGDMRLNPMSDELSREVKQAGKRGNENRDVTMEEPSGIHKYERHGDTLRTTVRTRNEGDVEWDLGHVQASFPFQTPSSENLFDIEPDADSTPFPECDWLAFDQDYNNWTPPTPSGAIVTTKKANPFTNTLVGGAALHSNRPKAPLSSAVLQQGRLTAHSRTHPRTSSGGENRLTTRDYPGAVHAGSISHGHNIHSQANRQVMTGPTQRAMRPVTPRHLHGSLLVPGQRQTQVQHYETGPSQLTTRSKIPTQQPTIIGASVHNSSVLRMLHHPLTPKHRPVTPTRKNQGTRHRPVTLAPPVHAHLIPEHEQPGPTNHPVLKTSREPTSYTGLLLDQNPNGNDHIQVETPNQSFKSEMSDIPPLPSPSDEDYDTIMEARHQMLLSRQRSHQQRRAARENAILDARMTTTTQTGFFGRTHPDRAQNMALTNQDSLSHTMAPQSLPAGNVERRYEYGYIIENGKPLPRSKGTHQSLQNSTSGSANTLHSHPHSTRRQQDIGRSAQPPSFYSKVRHTLGLSNTGGTTSKQALMSRLNSVRASRLRRSEGRRDRSAPFAQQRKENHRLLYDKVPQEQKSRVQVATSLRPLMGRESNAASRHYDESSITFPGAHDDQSASMNSSPYLSAMLEVE